MCRPGGQAGRRRSTSPGWQSGSRPSGRRFATRSGWTSTRSRRPRLPRPYSDRSSQTRRNARKSRTSSMSSSGLTPRTSTSTPPRPRNPAPRNPAPRTRNRIARTLRRIRGEPVRHGRHPTHHSGCGIRRRALRGRPARRRPQDRDGDPGHANARGVRRALRLTCRPCTVRGRTVHGVRCSQYRRHSSASTDWGNDAELTRVPRVRGKCIWCSATASCRSTPTPTASDAWNHRSTSRRLCRPASFVLAVTQNEQLRDERNEPTRNERTDAHAR